MKKNADKVSKNRLFPSSPDLIGLAILMCLQLIGTVLLYYNFSNYKHSTDAEFSALGGQVVTAVGALGMTKVSISPEDNAVYIPEARLRLPLNSQSLQLFYNIRDGGPRETDTQVLDIMPVNDVMYTSPKPQRLSCVPVRLAFESKANPYNPHEKPQSPVKLKDGRTLQIYAFQEDSCTQVWQTTGTDPMKVAAVFQEASSY